MSNTNQSGNGSGCLTAIIFLIVLGLLGMLFGEDTEYEKAGKTFGTWIKTDPNKWTNTQKDYFNDFMDWADRN